MIATRTWLVAARDPESAPAALARAISLSALGDRIVLAHVRRRGLLALLGAGAAWGGMPEPPADRPDDDAWLEAIRARTPAPHGVLLDTVVVDGEPAPALAAQAERLGAAAIVAAPARRGALREFALGSTLLRLLREAARPVVVAHGDMPGGWRTAAAAVSGDPSALRVVAAARTLAPAAALTLVHAWRVPEEGRLRLHGVDADRIRAVRDWARGAAEGALGEARATAPGAAFALVEGHAASAILDWGRQAKPDVLVVAAHRGAAAQERLLGSVTQFLLYHWPGDLVLVP